jgi:hypothetical protein
VGRVRGPHGANKNWLGNAVSAAAVHAHFTLSSDPVFPSVTGCHPDAEELRGGFYKHDAAEKLTAPFGGTSEPVPAPS